MPSAQGLPCTPQQLASMYLNLNSTLPTSSHTHTRAQTQTQTQTLDLPGRQGALGRPSAQGQPCTPQQAVEGLFKATLAARLAVQAITARQILLKSVSELGPKGCVVSLVARMPALPAGRAAKKQQQVAA